MTFREYLTESSPKIPPIDMVQKVIDAMPFNTDTVQINYRKTGKMEALIVNGFDDLDKTQMRTLKKALEHKFKGFEPGVGPSLAIFDMNSKEVNEAEIPQDIMRELKKLVQGDPFGLSPETLYNNIKNSTGTTKGLAEIFEVPERLIKKIISKS